MTALPRVAATFGAAVLLATALPAGSASAAVELCTRTKAGGTGVCVDVPGSRTLSGTLFTLRGRIGPAVRYDRNLRTVCLYRLRTGQRPETITYANRVPGVCTPIRRSAWTYALPIRLSRIGTWTYTIGPSRLVRGARANTSPAFTITTHR